MLQWMDDFTSYGTGGVGSTAALRLTNGAYVDQQFVTLVADPDPTAGGEGVLKLGHTTSTGGGYIRKALTTSQTTVGVAARYWLSVLPNGSQTPHFASFRDLNNKVHVYLAVDTVGYLQAYRVDATGAVLIAQSSSPIIIANAWRHMEIKCVLDAAGSIEARLEGATVLTASGIRTTSNVVGAVATIDQVAMVAAQHGTQPDLYVKDFIIWDGTGTVNNNFFGSCQVYKIIPDGDVSLGWTPSTGVTGYNLVNQTPPPDDTAYISAPFPVPAATTFSMSDLPVNVTSVKGVMAVTRSRKTDGGDGQLKVSLISGANTGNGSDRTITTAYTYWTDTFDQDPGAIPWTKALVDALQFKQDRTV